ncbi:MAG TPA: polyphosphate kinase 1 [Candidatus Binataceae bacterium]|nr:polyphosphate kinase 1 [Candidatus Binataceae bacterium]
MADQSKIGDPDLSASSSMSMAARNEAVASSPAVTPQPQPVANGVNGNGLALDGEGHAPVAAATAPIAAPTPAAGETLHSPALYLNRELTWLAFNQRVLAEAEDADNPLLERVKFLAIDCATIDEFFMKRIGGLKHQVVAGVHELTPDGRTPQQQIVECYERLREIEARQRKLLPQLIEELKARGIVIDSYQGLKPEQQKDLRDLYIKNVFPLVTPQALDPAHPFPFVSNLSLNLLVTVRYPADVESVMARVKVPLGHGISRFMRVGNENRFVPLEDVMDDNLDLLFPGMEVTSCEFFRVTRNANTERDEEEADDLLALIESELRDRRFSPIVRMEVAKGMDTTHRGMLAAELGLDEREDVFETDGMMQMRDLMELAAIDDPALHDPPHHPIDHPRLPAHRNIFHSIREAGSILLMHPYESFSTSVARFLREASEDPKVRAIKMTLYRTSSDAEIIGYLCDAARNGKQVAVVVELKARFDEAANIQFAEQLEDFGIHVTYGVIGLKTHSKVILVVRQDYTGLRRYAHIGTGNYHPGTARLYADYGLLTCDEVIGQDLTQLFNYLTTGYAPGRMYKKILPAPNFLKQAMIAKIDREIKLHSASSPGLIQLKCNALEDVDVTRALYRASMAGVKVDLIVRDTCRLRPGLAGISDNVRVVSIVGRFLEHGRIYYFRNGGAEEYFIGSADLMKRNLESRVEVITPVEDPALRKELRTVLDCQLAPNECAWEMQSDGSYIRRLESAANCQEFLIGYVDQQLKEASKRKRRKARGFARRPSRNVLRENEE